MAGDWIKMQTHLWDHPKVVRISSAICPQSVRDMSARCRVIGALFRTWALADTHSEDGILDGYDAEALDSVVGIEGWSLSLQHVGWLVVESQRLIVPRFEEHNGASAKRRAEDAKRKKSVRKTSEKSPQDVRKSSDKMRTREEKRREDSSSLEKKNQETQITFPASLDTPEFREAWLAWNQHRLEIKKPIKPTSAAGQLRRFERLGVAKAIAAIWHTIEKGWMGIREPEGGDVAPRSRVPSAETLKNWNATDGGLGSEFKG